MQCGNAVSCENKQREMEAHKDLKKMVRKKLSQKSLYQEKRKVWAPTMWQMSLAQVRFMLPFSYRTETLRKYCDYVTTLGNR